MFRLLILGVLAPPTFVLIGQRVMVHGCNHALACGKQVAELIEDMAKQVEPPTPAPGTAVATLGDFEDLVRAFIERKAKEGPES